MPYELIVQADFDEPVEGGGVRRRRAGEHITDQDRIDAIQSRQNHMLHVVKVWSNDEPVVDEPDTAPVSTAVLPSSSAPVSKPVAGPETDHTSAAGAARLAPTPSSAVAPTNA